MTPVEQNALSRRGFIARIGLGVAALGGLPLLQACAPAAPASPTAAPAPPAAAPKPAGTTAPAPAAPTVAPTVTAAAAPKPAANATPALATAAGTPVLGGTLRTTLGAEPTSLDPHMGSSLFNEDVRIHMFDALTEGTNQDVAPALAEKWDSSDGKTWIFSLRPGVKFHDGTPLKSSMVKASIERVLDPATGAGQVRGKVVQVAGVEAPDDGTVRITLKDPNGAFPLDIADISIIPPNFDETKPVGTGPFQFVEWVRNQRISLKKNPEYFRKGLPYLDGLTFQTVPDENQKIVLLQAGQVDFTDTIPLPRVKEVQQGGKINVISTEPGTSASSYFMPVNTRKAPLNNAKVRQAMNLALDREALLQVTFGFGTIKSSVVPPKSWAYNPNAISYDKRDVAKAKQLLAEAGLANGFSVELKHLTSRAEYIPMAQLFQANLADIGVKLTLVPKELGVWVDEVLNKYDFELGLTGITPANDPSAMMERYSSEDADGKSMAWVNEEYESLLKQGRAAVGEEKRKPIYFKAQELVQPEAPGFVVNERVIVFGASPAVNNYEAYLGRTNFQKVWLQK
jgi:peptide/nickel transport system substrate-binding protein